MNVDAVIAEIRKNPQINEAGMILTHLGLVRGVDLNGRPVKRLHLSPNPSRAELIRTEMLARPGVVDIVVRLKQGWLGVGQWMMIAAVAGRTRTEILPVMAELIDRLKAEAVTKEEELA